MSINSILFFLVVTLLIILAIMIGLLFRVRRLEEKSADISASDVAAFVDQMREMLIESERIAEKLDASIRERESVLEDLSDLVEGRLTRLQQIDAYKENPSIENLLLGDSPLQTQVYQMFLRGDSEKEISKKLGITLTEVNMIIHMSRE